MRLLPVAVLLLNVAATSVHAQDSTRLTSVMPDNGQTSWETVLALPVGTFLQVETGSGEKIEGHVRSVSGNRLLLDTGNAAVELSQDATQRVVRLGARKTGQRARRGFLIGAGLGAAMGGFGAKSNRLAWMTFLAAGWGAIGAAIGALDGVKTRDATLVYQAPVP
jgi:hypothetical protein